MDNKNNKKDENKDFDIWKEFKIKAIIFEKNYITINKVKFKNNNKNEIIKKYNKNEYKNYHSYDIDINKIKNLINQLLIIQTYNSTNFYCIVIQYCDFELIEYLAITEKSLTYMMKLKKFL
jgi:hypothetical protein